MHHFCPTCLLVSRYSWVRRWRDFMAFIVVIFRSPPGNSPAVDLMGIAVGHVYYFLEDVYPHTRGGR